MKLHYIAMLAVAAAVSAGLAQAEETTHVYRQGNSTATITQSGGGSTMTHRTTDGPDGQTIVQSQGGNRAVVTQSARSDMAPSSPGLDEASMQMMVRMSPEDRQNLEELASDEDTTVEALVEEAIREFLDRNR